MPRSLALCFRLKDLGFQILHLSLQSILIFVSRVSPGFYLTLLCMHILFLQCHWWKTSFSIVFKKTQFCHYIMYYLTIHIWVLSGLLNLSSWLCVCFMLCSSKLDLVVQIRTFFPVNICFSLTECGGLALWRQLTSDSHPTLKSKLSTYQMKPTVRHLPPPPCVVSLVS